LREFWSTKNLHHVKVHWTNPEAKIRMHEKITTNSLTIHERETLGLTLCWKKQHGAWLIAKVYRYWDMPQVCNSDQLFLFFR